MQITQLKHAFTSDTEHSLWQIVSCCWFQQFPDCWIHRGKDTSLYRWRMWEEQKRNGSDKKSEWIPPPPAVDSWSNSWAIIGRVRGVDIWRCAYDQFFILINVCLHCFLSKLKDLCILKSLVQCILPLLETGQLDLVSQTGLDIFNRVHTVLPDWWEKLWNLCPSLPLFTAQSSHFLPSNGSRSARKDCSHTSLIRRNCPFSMMCSGS